MNLWGNPVVAGFNFEQIRGLSVRENTGPLRGASGLPVDCKEKLTLDKKAFREERLLRFACGRLLGAGCYCLRRDGRRRLLFAIRLLAGLLSGLADVDSALEERAVFDRDARSHNVAGE